MRQRTVMTVLMSGLVAAVLAAASVPEPAEPEYQSVIMRLSDTGELVPLERKTPILRSHQKQLFGAESAMEIDGERSPVRLLEKQSLVFVVRVASQLVDPQSILEIVRWDIRRGKRVVVVAKVSSWNHAVTANPQVGNKVPFDAAKYGASSFKFSPVNPLQPGEYELGVKGSDDTFDFGIDPAPPESGKGQSE